MEHDRRKLLIECIRGPQYAGDVLPEISYQKFLTSVADVPEILHYLPATRGYCMSNPSVKPDPLAHQARLGTLSRIGLAQDEGNALILCKKHMFIHKGVRRGGATKACGSGITQIRIVRLI